MIQWFLIVMIGSMPIGSTSTSTGSFSSTTLGPISYDACIKAAKAVRDSQTEVSAICAQQLQVAR